MCHRLWITRLAAFDTGLALKNPCFAACWGLLVDKLMKTDETAVESLTRSINRLFYGTFSKLLWWETSLQAEALSLKSLKINGHSVKVSFWYKNSFYFEIEFIRAPEIIKMHFWTNHWFNDLSSSSFNSHVSCCKELAVKPLLKIIYRIERYGSLTFGQLCFVIQLTCYCMLLKQWYYRISKQYV